MNYNNIKSTYSIKKTNIKSTKDICFDDINGSVNSINDINLNKTSIKKEAIKITFDTNKNHNLAENMEMMIFLKMNQKMRI